MRSERMTTCDDVPETQEQVLTRSCERKRDDRQDKSDCRRWQTDSHERRELDVWTRSLRQKEGVNVSLLPSCCLSRVSFMPEIPSLSLSCVLCAHSFQDTFFFLFSVYHVFSSTCSLSWFLAFATAVPVILEWQVLFLSQPWHMHVATSLSILLKKKMDRKRDVESQEQVRQTIRHVVRHACLHFYFTNRTERYTAEFAHMKESISARYMGSNFKVQTEMEANSFVLSIC